MNASLGRFVRNRQARVLPAAIFLRKEQSARSTKQLSQEHISQMQNDASQISEVRIVLLKGAHRETGVCLYLTFLVFSHLGKSFQFKEMVDVRG